MIYTEEKNNFSFVISIIMIVLMWIALIFVPFDTNSWYSKHIVPFATILVFSLLYSYLSYRKKRNEKTFFRDNLLVSILSLCVILSSLYFGYADSSDNALMPMIFLGTLFAFVSIIPLIAIFKQPSFRTIKHSIIPILHCIAWIICATIAFRHRDLEQVLYFAVPFVLMIATYIELYKLNLIFNK